MFRSLGMTRTLGGRYEQYTGTEGLADDWSPEGASASPARRSCANGRFVDARYLLSRWAWFTRLLRLRPSEGNNRLAASDADCSNAAFFSAQSVCSTVLVEPCLDPVEPRTQPIGRDADPNTHRKASFSRGDHEPGTSSHWCVPLFFCKGPRTPLSGSPASLGLAVEIQAFESGR